MELFRILGDLAALSVEEISAWIEETRAQVAAITSNPTEYVSETLSSADLVAAVREATEALQTARAELTSRAAEAETAAADDTAAFAELAELGTLASAEDETDPEDPEDPDVDPEPEPETAAVEDVETVTASAVPRRRLPRPTAERLPIEHAQEPMVALTAAAGASGVDAGSEFPSMDSIAEAMQTRRRQFGLIAAGTEGEKVPIARADWSSLYGPERTLSGDALENEALIAAALTPQVIKSEMAKRKANSLVATGGLCAPVTPYYQLAMISQANRPVRAGLPAFNADRGGIRFARPATLAAITTGVGTKTQAQDAAGGTEAVKTCQVVSCPPFSEVDVQILFHCLQFGNLGARTFPERVTQWNNLTLAAHARLAESWLLTGIDTASTQVTAASLGLGAIGSLLGEILAAANAMRNRHRMDPEAVLRLMLPDWAIDLLISDKIRSQFERLDTDEAKITALLRSFDVEPSFYIDSAFGRSQVFGAQSAGALLPFPSTVVWYLFPEGSFLFVDGGTLELGLVRDSVLNSTNDFQIFGETFENVAFVGVESLAVASTVCDSGVTAGTHNTPCPIDYTHTS